MGVPVGLAELRRLAATVRGGELGRIANELGVRVLDLVCAWMGDSELGAVPEVSASTIMLCITA